MRSFTKRTFLKLIQEISEAHLTRLNNKNDKQEIKIRIMERNNGKLTSVTPENWKIFTEKKVKSDSFTSCNYESKDEVPAIQSYVPEIHKRENGEKYFWKKELTFLKTEKGEKYNFEGWIGLSSKIEHKPGLMLAWNNRIVNFYFPQKIFGKSNPHRRIIGLIKVSQNWPVTQTKDNISWESNLEEIFQSKILDFLTHERIFAQASEIRTSEESDKKKESWKNDFREKFISQLEKNYRDNNEKTDLFINTEKTKEMDDKFALEYDIKYENKNHEYVLTLENSKKPKKIIEIMDNKKDSKKKWEIKIFVQHHMFKSIKEKQTLSSFAIFLIGITNFFIFNSKENKINELNNFLNEYCGK